jgi:DNA-binding response OmpR family regulator
MTMTQRLKDYTILIVDDDEDILSSYVLAIRTEGADIRTATDGNEALAACEDGAVDAVILDMMLPKRSGFLVLERLMELEDPPYVVMVTANQGKRHMEYARSLGVDAYLVKPVPLQRLIETIEKLIEDDDE